MKVFMLIILGCLMTGAYAQERECKVYGISDSPQKLDCTFGSLKVALRCVDGTYYINSTKVNSAYHMDVEEGGTPLVFEGRRTELTVVMEEKIDIQAEYKRWGRRTRYGSCL